MASMRPGRLTPENPSNKHRLVRRPAAASMRPGRLTPENLRDCQQKKWHGSCFNEAGAINPGKPLYEAFTVA